MGTTKGEEKVEPFVEVQEVLETPAQVEEPKIDVEAIKTELEKTKQELDKWQKEAKAHQRTASSKSQEAQRARDEVSSINARIDLLAETLEDRLLNQASTEILEEKRKPSYKERLQQVEQQRQTGDSDSRRAYINNIANEIVTLTTPKGMQFDKTPELRDAYVKWLEGDYEGAKEMVKEIVTKVAEAKKEEETDESKFERMYQERRRKEMEADGTWKSDKITPSGKTANDEQIRKNFRENSTDPQARKAYLEYVSRAKGY
jgi:hypothetical protein